MPNEDQLQSLQSAVAELRVINRVLDKICRLQETRRIMSVIVDELVGYTGADQGVVTLVTQERDQELVTVVRRWEGSDDIPYRVGDSVSGWVLKNKQVLKIDDLDRDDRFPGTSSENGRFACILCCPMLMRGEAIGLASLVRSNSRGPFRDSDARLCGIVASQSAPILRNAILLEELARKNELLHVSQKKLHEENIKLRAEVGSAFAFEGIIGKSAVMAGVLSLASKVAETDAPVLITGPTGTGKELVARAIHYHGSRRDRPFVVKNCGVKTETLLEAELFGHVKGAFTGADRDKPGLFKEADGGTVFLDEIGEAPPSTQVAILRVLETGEIRPVGAGKTQYVDVRVISATNRDLKQEIETGAFRRDLFYRLNTFTLELPPLSRRREDIPLLVRHFLGKLRVRLGIEDMTITPEALQLLSSFDWPGNIRQLENELERAAVVSERSGIIDVRDLSADIRNHGAKGPQTRSGQLRDIVADVEAEVIRDTLTANAGNILRTSQVLGLTRKGLKDKMARYGIDTSGL